MSERAVGDRLTGEVITFGAILVAGQDGITAYTPATVSPYVEFMLSAIDAIPGLGDLILDLYDRAQSENHMPNGEVM